MKGMREEDTIAEGPKPLSLDSALQKATEGAFMHVRKKIQNASDLENLAQNRQSAYATHQEKIACLKARVQGLVTNIEMGIDDLDSTADNLYGLLRDIEHIQSESTHATSHFSGKHFEDLKSLATFWERIVQVDNLITQFRKTDNIIASIEKFFKDNPDGFSIKCFTAIDGLLTFEKELLLFTINLPFINFYLVFILQQIGIQFVHSYYSKNMLVGQTFWKVRYRERKSGDSKGT